MLTWFGVEFCLVTDCASSALQKQVSAFTAGKFGFWSKIACHVIFLYVIYRTEMREPSTKVDGGGLVKN
jgi:hypothetical protein